MSTGFGTYELTIFSNNKFVIFNHLNIELQNGVVMIIIYIKTIRFVIKHYRQLLIATRTMELYRESCDIAKGYLFEKNIEEIDKINEGKLSYNDIINNLKKFSNQTKPLIESSKEMIYFCEKSHPLLCKMLGFKIKKYIGQTI